MKLQVFYVLCFVFFNHSHTFKIKVNKCLTKAKTHGFCREETACVAANEPLLQEACPTNYVCCPVRDVSRKKCYEYAEAVTRTGRVMSVDGDVEEATEHDCGLVVESLIIGGSKAKEKEFPHMVAVGLRKTPDSEVTWQCGGSLISEMYILTAAHCYERSNDPKSYVLKLGVVNLYSNDVTNVQDRYVETVIQHPGYRGSPITVHDIALMKMNKKVMFTPYVRPPCLDYKGDFREESALAIGHGITTSLGNKANPDLLKVTLNISEKAVCDKRWSATYKNGLPESMICAGSKGPNKDTCSGDSGGPLQVFREEPYCMYSLIGVTAIGIGCGDQAYNNFNIYDRVFYYIPWIESIVWPGET